MAATIDELAPLERDLAVEFGRRLRQALPGRVLDLKVFGSRARGDAHAESDLDIFVLLDRAPVEDRFAVWDLAFALWLERMPPFELSPRVLDRDHYHQLIERERLFPQELERDGISL